MEIKISDEVVLHKLKSGQFITKDTVFRILGFSDTNYTNIMSHYKTLRHLQKHNYQGFQMVNVPSKGGYRYELMLELNCLRVLTEYLKKAYKCVKAAQVLRTIFQGYTEEQLA